MQIRDNLYYQSIIKINFHLAKNDNFILIWVKAA